MRQTLAARPDRDIASAAPRRRSGPSHSSRGRLLLAAALQRPGVLVGGLAITATAAAIIVNALSFQSARHPAPFFAKGEGIAASRREPAVPVLPPMPPTRPPSVTSTAALPPATPRITARDPIGEIIRAADATGSTPAAARPAEDRAEPQRHIAAAQRALVKLGYGPLKIDGIMGQETRQTIERFERDRRLTPTGELGLRTTRELSAQSGIRVE